MDFCPLFFCLWPVAADRWCCGADKLLIHRLSKYELFFSICYRLFSQALGRTFKISIFRKHTRASPVTALATCCVKCCHKPDVCLGSWCQRDRGEVGHTCPQCVTPVEADHGHNCQEHQPPSHPHDTLSSHHTPPYFRIILFQKVLCEGHNKHQFIIVWLVIIICYFARSEFVSLYTQFSFSLDWGRQWRAV